MTNSLVEMGNCFQVHGIRGGLNLILHNQKESMLRAKTLVTLFPLSEKSQLKKTGCSYELEEIRFGNKTLTYFKGVNSRDDAEKLVPFSLHVERSEFPQNNLNGAYYLHDLIGLKAFAEDGGEMLGTVIGHYGNGVQTILAIADSNEKTVLELPLVKHFFPAIDLAAGRITVRVPGVVDAG